MTQFNTIELLFNQLFKLTEEIKTAVVQEAYSEADNKLKSREALFKKIVNAAKTATLTDTEEQKISELDTKFKRMEKENTILFEKIRDEFKEKLKETKKHVKVNSAYMIKTDESSALFYDGSE